MVREVWQAHCNSWSCDSRGPMRATEAEAIAAFCGKGER
jgi:hypothetical protein